MSELETEVQLIKRDIEDVKSIHTRLDVAIDKLTDVSNSIHRMLAVHEEKLARQEEASVELEQQIEKRRSEVLTKIDDLHSRITTNTKEIIVCDYKSQANSHEVEAESYLSSGWHQGYKNQMDFYNYLLNLMGFKTADTSYFYVVNANRAANGFHSKLEFTETLIPYKHDFSWILFING